MVENSATARGLSSRADPGRWPRLLLLAAPMLVAIGLVALRSPGSTGDTGPSSGGDGIAAAGTDAVAPIDVMASAPTFTNQEELLGAGDLVVVATVISREPGRRISDPQDPTAGIQTTLFELAVEEVIVGVDGIESVVVEHETALLDGTPITIDGIGSPRLGERGLFVLVAGSQPTFPHHALAAPDSWASIGARGLLPPPGASDDHPLAALDLATVRAAARS